MWELQAGFVSRNESGNATFAPGSGIDAVARLYSPPIAERWRAVAAAERFTAEPPEGRAVRNSFGAGAELRLPDLTVEALGWQNTGTVSEWGASIAGTWEPNDHWTFGADAERFAPDTPLRALLYDITANAAGGWARYAWNESSWLSAGVRGLDFSDGNRRRQVRAVFAQRVVDKPHFDLTIRPEIYGSTNSLAGAPYFNPERDFAAAVAFDAEHVLWRRYERSWTQRLQVTAGSYWQKGFGSGGVGGALYEQALRRDPFTDLRYGLEWNRRIYDGVPEETWIFFVNFVQRF
jgi:biofilm PGA synthesis protein PgaA